MKTENKNAPTTWRSRILSCLIVCLMSLGILIVGFFIALMVYLLIICPWQYKHGYDFNGASTKYYRAMQGGDGMWAIHWAKRAEAYSNSTLRNGTYFDLAQAYDLNGQHDVAVHYYALARYESRKRGENEIGNGPKFLYEQGKRKEAFEAYCAQAFVFRIDSPERKILYRDRIMRDFNPFASFTEFQAFMEEEYNTLGCPEGYLNVMEIIRGIDKPERAE